MKLNFYKQPFHRAKYGTWVYDIQGNFVFQFERDYDNKGNYIKGQLELEDEVISSLNSEEHKPISLLKLRIYKDDPNQILNNELEFITIRGWGNLTGVGAHNLPAEQAAKIQDDFANWIIWKLLNK